MPRTDDRPSRPIKISAVNPDRVDLKAYGVHPEDLEILQWLRDLARSEIPSNILNDTFLELMTDHDRRMYDDWWNRLRCQQIVLSDFCDRVEQMYRDREDVVKARSRIHDVLETLTGSLSRIFLKERK